jgi:hypothetical protein
MKWSIRILSLLSLLLLFTSLEAACWTVPSYYGPIVRCNGPGPWGPPPPPPGPGPYWGPGPYYYPPPPPGPWRQGPGPACWRNWRGVMICN